MECARRARRVALCSCGRAEPDRRITHPRSYLLHANHKCRTSRSTSEPDRVGKSKKRAQPLSKWSDDRTQSVGCFRTGCRGWLSSGNDANVCFTTGARALLVWPTVTWLRKLLSRGTLGVGKQPQPRTLLSSPFFLQTCMLQVTGVNMRSLKCSLPSLPFPPTQNGWAATPVRRRKSERAEKQTVF